MIDVTKPRGQGRLYVVGMRLVNVQDFKIVIS